MVDKVNEALDRIASNLRYYQQEVGRLHASDHPIVTDSDIELIRTALQSLQGNEGAIRIEGTAYLHRYDVDDDVRYHVWPGKQFSGERDEYPCVLYIHDTETVAEERP